MKTCLDFSIRDSGRITDSWGSIGFYKATYSGGAIGFYDFGIGSGGEMGFGVGRV